jgi:UDP-N-acetylglucosamine--N-acetylmuramyl-(pentapeptide) pyrophosphoryl-undecaprenol N-acetylglucosamine transferase
VLPVMKDQQQLAAMQAAAGQVGTRSGTENLIALVDRALRAS